MKRFLIIVALCALAAAMVPRERRALNTEKNQICHRRTPCAWSVYKTNSKIIEYNITNTYCICSRDTVCQIDEDDTAVNTYILRCLPPEQETTKKLKDKTRV